MFVIPSVVLAVVLSFPSLALIVKLLLEPIMGVDFLPVPTPKAFFLGVGLGVAIPLVSSLIPLKVVLSKNLNDALDYTHSKTKAVYVKILKSN